MANRLDGKVAIVTGAGSGIGKAIAIDYIKEGAKIVAQDIIEDRLKELEQEISEMGLSENLRVIKGDIRNTDDCQKLLDTCIEAYGTCNVVSHNAGVNDKMYAVANIPDDDWDRTIAINLTGSMKVTRTVLKYFTSQAEANGGEFEASIVMITSNAAFQSATGGPSYAASKAGANALMKSIAFEYGRMGIRCNSICPGAIMTNIVSAMGDMDKAGSDIHLRSGYNEAGWKWTGGIIGMPEDISPLAVYLASDESKYMNGNSCVIDSGICLSR